MIVLLVLAALIILGAVGFLAFYLWRIFESKVLINLIQIETYLIKFPQEKAENKDFKAEINKSEQLFSALSSLKFPVAFEVAVPHVGEEIYFYIAIPRKFSGVAAKQIQGIWPKANIEKMSDDYNIFAPQGASAATYLTLKDPYALPIRTYTEIGADSFLPIIEGFSKINEVNEGAALQIMIRPAPSDAKKNILNYIGQLKKGGNLSKMFHVSLSPFSLKDVGEAISPSKKPQSEQPKIIDETAVKALEFKVSKPLFSVNARIVVSAGSPYQVDEIMSGISAGFSQLTAPEKNEFNVVKVRNPKNLFYEFIFRKFNDSKAMILNSEEVASFFHLPTFSLMTPKLKWLKSAESAPPSNLPKEGTLIGESNFRGERKSVYITPADRLRHFYAIGQTGTGKTTLIRNMAVDDIKKGKGVAIIDPHGDFVESVLGLIPKERMEDVVIFDPGDLWRPLGLNMLEYDFNRPEEKTFIANEMLSILIKLFPDSGDAMGPMFQQYMRNALLLLMEDMPNEPATLMEISRVFTDDVFRERKLERIRNPAVIDFWEKEATKTTGEAGLANMTPYITSKFGIFTANDYMRPIIGQPKSAFNFRKLMDEGKILLVNLSKGKIGDINANLLGMIITGKILMAALSRVDIADENQRKDFYLYIDEFQNFTTDSIAIILSEARKYRLSLTVAHQFIAQLTDKIKDAVFGNVGSMAVLRVSATDAEFLAKQFEPTFSQQDLMSIDNLNAYAKILINGETSKPFNFKILFPPKGDQNIAREIKEYSRQKYGADRQIVEEEIYKRLRF
ncbi:MAG: type IV secretion system DNA-binding domain-containing protein [Patescibacteria group bacterium]|nr:type IV secretion system DNA-binding domain-containing protein [Patescibacteria group bacterium]